MACTKTRCRACSHAVVAAVQLLARVLHAAAVRTLPHTRTHTHTHTHSAEYYGYAAGGPSSYYSGGPTGPSYPDPADTPGGWTGKVLAG
jgi:hypothetical protein